MEKTAKILGILIMVIIILSIGNVARIYIFRQVDNISLQFVNDPEVLGEWFSVDIVEDIEKFTPGIKSTEKSLYMNRLEFLPEGKLHFNNNNERPWFKWTKGVVTHSGDKTAEKYIIKEIDGKKYMFIQSKSGDYVYGHEKPPYYVLIKGN